MAGLKITAEDEQYLKVMYLRNKKQSSKDLTVHLRLIRNGLSESVTAKKPFLREGNKEKMLKHELNS